MTHPSNLYSAATRTAAPAPRARGRRLLVIVITALAGMTLSNQSFAATASSPKSQHAISAPARHAPPQKPKARASQTKTKSKQALAERPTQRKKPVKARVAKKSPTPTRAQQTPRKPERVATKKSKRVA